MPIGISGGAIRNKKGTFKAEDKIKKIVQTYGTIFLLTENGMLSGFGVNNSLQIGGSFVLEAELEGQKQVLGGVLVSVKIKSNYVKAWNLLGAANLHYMYFSPDIINRTTEALKPYNNQIIDFDAGYTIDSKKDYKKIYVSSVLKNFSLMVLKNGKLLGWGYNSNLELGVDSDVKSLMLPNNKETYKWENNQNTFYPTVRPILDALHKSLYKTTVFTPKVLNTSTNWTSVVANNIGEYYKHILLNSSGEIYIFGGDLNTPEKLGSSNDWKYISYDYAINNTNELYRLRTTDTTSITSAVKHSGYVNKQPSTVYRTIYDTSIDILSFDLKEVILESGKYEKSIVNLNLYLFKNGKLFASGSNFYTGLNDNSHGNDQLDYSNYSIGLISIDEIIGEKIKSAYQCCGAYFAITDTNKLYTWGNNHNGDISAYNTYSIGRTRLNRPTGSKFLTVGKIETDNIAKIVPTNMATYVIGTNGGLSAAGYNFTGGTLGNNNTTAGAVHGLNTILSAGVKDVTSLVTTSYAVGTNGLLSAWGFHANGTAGWLNDVVTSIRYGSITGAVSGIDGNLYVCDPNWGSIKQINSKKQVKTFLNLGTLNLPTSITQDSSGNLYVTANHAVLKITPEKMVTTFAGSTGTSGNVNAQGENARFNTPRGITIDSSNNLYVCDSLNNSIKKITPTGTVSLFAGSENGVAGSTNSPLNINTTTTVIAGGDGHSLFLRSDGTVWSCGYNGHGQLGVNSLTDKKTPVQISTLTDVISVAAGGDHSLFLRSDGTVWGCGNNGFGQLGDGTTARKSVPIQVSNWTDVIAIAAGGSHSLFLRSNGTAWACGANASGQLGDGTTTNRSTPVRVSTWTDVIAIAANGYNSLFLRSDGTVWSCGYNGYGQLGDGTTTNRSTPVRVSTWTDVIAIAAGGSHSLFLRSNDTVWSCGSKSFGQLGDGTANNTIIISTPVQVSNLTNVTVIDANRYHSLFLRSNGTAWACGANTYGQLGDGSSTNRSTPVQVEKPSAKFNLPRGITIDRANNDLFVADTDNHIVRQITSAGVVTTVAGVAETAGNTIGASTTVARLTSPVAIGYTSNGIYVKAGSFIRRITATDVLAVVGNTSTTKFQNGFGTNGLINLDLAETGSIIINGTNSLLYTDSANYCLRGINTTNTTIDLYSGSGGIFGNVVSDGKVNQPKPIELGNAENIDRIVVDGGDTSILGYAITNDKKVYAWGDLTSTKYILEPELLPLPPVKDVVIVLNAKHKSPYGVNVPKIASTYFIGNDGGLSAIGERYLGNGTNTKSDDIIKINIPAVKKLVTTGASNIYVLGIDGGLSAWGGDDGYLGVSTGFNILSPTKINLPPIEDIYTTNTAREGYPTANRYWSTVIVLGTNKSLSGWGQGMNLGFEDPKTGSLIPVALTAFEPQVTGVYPSYSNTIVSYNTSKLAESHYYLNPIKIGTDTDWKTVDKHGDFAIKTDNTLWSISSTPYQIGTDTDYENVFYNTPVKTTDPYDIKLTTKKYFTSTDVDAVSVLKTDKTERTIINFRENNTSANFLGISANTLHQNVNLYTGSNFDTTNFKFNIPSVVKY
jgi:alpha-tubulin suppressor-like RCC1 family protein